ncbi:ATP-binding protein [Streptomyces acidiscabies]|uniref:ATP-binding protein n=1 Tax=Streptomyces acidiscabies TaxID=42234 RepID=A0AAP6EKL2_9ACTN|nr:ATP-binding protein [Streptomyces acidiscabies]MBP5937302.1 ATP-binding protein [Streptomyces sp. LBUM 1476]MBZ3914633.1 ATP-binding protein [Streptomyces acidiscabies]MDX2966184.1 ATP-binding protein [Streptomyces acidiscabies]MDX3025547.1 ATP-binding protein [Streptomyces acidiscabies]MDX3796176.1 ATP-binding protein [Streptomyces acidiscabies]
MSFEHSLLATPKAVPDLRHRLREHSYDVRLCATELITNVIDHVGDGTPVTIRVLPTAPGHTRIEVTDPAPNALPILQQATTDDESGRGLALLTALARRWGVEWAAGRKTVWCEISDS